MTPRITLSMLPSFPTFQGVRNAAKDVGAFLSRRVIYLRSVTAHRPTEVVSLPLSQNATTKRKVQFASNPVEIPPPPLGVPVSDDDDSSTCEEESLENPEASAPEKNAKEIELFVTTQYNTAMNLIGLHKKEDVATALETVKSKYNVIKIFHEFADIVNLYNTRIVDLNDCSEEHTAENLKELISIARKYVGSYNRLRDALDIFNTFSIPNPPETFGVSPMEILELIEASEVPRDEYEEAYSTLKEFQADIDSYKRSLAKLSPPSTISACSNPL